MEILNRDSIVIKSFEPEPGPKKSIEQEADELTMKWWENEQRRLAVKYRTEIYGKD